VLHRFLFLIVKEVSIAFRGDIGSLTIYELLSIMDYSKTDGSAEEESAGEQLLRKLLG
jgi:hypothetical protein